MSKANNATTMATHIAELGTLLGDSQLLTGDDIGERYHVDWSLENAQAPALVIRPRDTADISAALKYCHANDLSVVTQGGLSGLAGGATPLPGEIAISLERLKGIVEIDEQSMTLTARAGTPLQVVQQAAAAKGLRLPLDLGARGSAAIGGNVSTNAGGNQVLSFGMTRALVLGLEAVLADGTIIPAHNKMLKNNAGYDLKQLFIGSEGTLGIVTEVTLRLFPEPRNKHTALVALGDFDSVVSFMRSAQGQCSRLTAFEAMWQDYYQSAVAANPLAKDCFDSVYPMYVLLEAENDAAEQFEQFLFGHLESGLLKDVAIAQSGRDVDGFWSIRDSSAEVMADMSGYANFDVGLPVSRMGDFLDATYSGLKERFEQPQSMTFGHLADGNLHIIAWTKGADNSKGIYQLIYQLVGEFGGTVTAEHGIGMMKTEYLKHSRSEAEIALMRVLKNALDPKGILNRGRVIPE